MSDFSLARRHLASFASYIRRNDLTGWVKDRNASGQFERALRAVVAVEDAEGIAAAAALSDRLTALRLEAMSAGLLTAEDVCRVESAVCGVQA